MKITRVILLILGVGAVANATVDRRTGPASFKLAIGAAMLAVYSLTEAARPRENEFQPFTKPPGVKPGILPGKR